MRNKHPEAWPWYGAGMRAQPQPKELNGEPVRRAARRARMSPDDLYRYVPVPPAYYDADGYLVEDGMSQNVDHQGQTSIWCHMLRLHLPAATVCSDLAVHYREGDRKAPVVPDLFVAWTPPLAENRTSYKLWEYPVPALVIEMLSGGGTAKKDVGSKRRTYEHLGVREYWLFDPAGHKLPTPLVGYRLRAGRYRPIAANAAGRLPSRVLDLDLHVRDGELRFRDPVTDEDLRTLGESESERALAESERAAAERGRTAERNRADAAEDRADAAENRASAAENRASVAEDERDAAERGRMAEKGRADAAERELARLRSRIGGS